MKIRIYPTGMQLIEITQGQLNIHIKMPIRTWFNIHPCSIGERICDVGEFRMRWLWPITIFWQEPFIDSSDEEDEDDDDFCDEEEYIDDEEYYC